MKATTTPPSVLRRRMGISSGIGHSNANEGRPSEHQQSGTRRNKPEEEKQTPPPGLVSEYSLSLNDIN